jgi:hypothetical protein
MAVLVDFRLRDGGSIVVEMEEERAGVVAAGRRPGEVAKEAAQTFEDAVAQVRPAAEAVARELRKISPNELSIELGIKLTAEAGAIIAKAGGEANFKVTMKWEFTTSREAAAGASES